MSTTPKPIEDAELLQQEQESKTEKEWGSMNLNLIILDGAYPTNPIWATTSLLIMMFEILVIAIECSFFIGNWSWVKNNKKHALLIIVLANLLTFEIGAIVQSILSGGV